MESDSVKIIQSNNLEWKYVPNTTRLVADGIHRENIVQAIHVKKVNIKNTFILIPIKQKSKDLESKIRTEFKRIERFQVHNYFYVENKNKFRHGIRRY